VWPEPFRIPAPQEDHQAPNHHQDRKPHVKSSAPIFPTTKRRSPPKRNRSPTEAGRTGVLESLSRLFQIRYPEMTGMKSRGVIVIVHPVHAHLAIAWGKGPEAQDEKGQRAIEDEWGGWVCWLLGFIGLRLRRVRR